MGHGRGRRAAVAGGLVVFALGLPGAPASADPATVPTMTAPAAGTVWGDVTLTAQSDADLVQFYVNDSTTIGTPVSVDPQSHLASTTWSTWALADGAYSLTAADCDTIGCNTVQSPAVSVTVDNVPTITASPVTGDVTITASVATPAVQFYVGGVAYGSPVTVVNGSASVSWSTWSLSNDDLFSWTAAGCDPLGAGCDATQSSAVVLQPDNTPPTFTAPGDTTVSGIVTLTATTNAPKVQFYEDAVAFGDPVAVDPTSHSASVQWTTYGAFNRDYDWAVAECDANGDCNPAQSSLILTLANTAVITSPADHATVGTTVTIDASATGGGLAFFVDGNQVSFDGSAPYGFTTPSPLTFGEHTASVKACDATGTTCNGPVSTITFTVSRLSPSIASVSPNPFSPGNDGHFDRTSFRVHLPDAEHVSFRVVNGNGQTIQGPHSPVGTLGAGDHVFTWDGRNNSAKFAGDGVYTIVVTTTRTTGGATLQGTATADVRVDRTPPAFSAITGNNTTTYPAADGFLDYFRPSVHVNEGGRLWFEITTTSGRRVRVLAKPHASVGTFNFSWNARDAAGRRVPAGNYHYRFIAEDRAGNRSMSRTLAVGVSYQHTVRAAARRSRNGNLGRPSATDSYCTQYSLGFSIFKHGLWLDNSCDRGFDGNQFIYADYTMAVPGAVWYDSISVGVLGETTHAPEPISAYVYDFRDRTWDRVGTAMLTKNAKPVRTTFGPISGFHHVSLRHRVRVRIAVPDRVTPEDYDIASVSMLIRYRVLSR